MIKLAIELPAYGHKLDAGHAAMWTSFGFAVAANDTKFIIVDHGVVDANPVADARNMALERALIAEADWVLMIDADTYVDNIDDAGVALLQMISDAHKRKAAIVGAPVRAREWDGHHRTVWRLDEVSRIADIGGKVPVPTMSRAPEEYYADKLVETPRIGGACMAVNLGWIREKMPVPPWFTHEPNLMGSRESRLRGSGEDVVFCDMVRIRGGLILCDGRVLPKHVMKGERL